MGFLPYYSQQEAMGIGAAGSGKRGIKKLSQNSPDAMELDLGLRKMLWG
jgi:DNA-binding response OmpR family regulator